MLKVSRSIYEGGCCFTLCNVFVPSQIMHKWGSEYNLAQQMCFYSGFIDYCRWSAKPRTKFYLRPSLCGQVLVVPTVGQVKAKRRPSVDQVRLAQCLLMCGGRAGSNWGSAFSCLSPQMHLSQGNPVTTTLLLEPDSPNIQLWFCFWHPPLSSYGRGEEGGRGRTCMQRELSSRAAACWFMFMFACWLVVVSILVIPIASHNDKRLFQLSVVGRKLSAVSWNKKKCCRLLLIWKGTKCPFIWYGPSWDYKNHVLSVY